MGAGKKNLFLSLGSNISPEENLIEAVRLLIKHFGKNIDISPVYKTDPRDFTDQPAFLNAVLKIKTDKTPEEILSLTQSVEKILKRKRDPKIPKGPRTIDIDILLLGNTVSDNPKLTIPHPSMEERGFVIIPLADIDKEASNPQTGVKYSSILKKVNDQGVYRYPLDLYNLLYDDEKS